MAAMSRSETTYQEHFEPLERLLRLSKLLTALQSNNRPKVPKTIINTFTKRMSYLYLFREPGISQSYLNTS